MNRTVLPVGIQSDIDECFCFMEDTTYQTRAHAYLEAYQVYRKTGDTAVQATVNDLCKRAFEEGFKAGSIESASSSSSMREVACKSALQELLDSDDAIREFSEVSDYKTSVGLCNKLNELIEAHGYDMIAFIKSDRVFVMKEE